MTHARRFARVTALTVMALAMTAGVAGAAVVALILAIKIGHAILRLVFGLIGVAVIVGAVWWFFLEH